MATLLNTSRTGKAAAPAATAPASTLTPSTATTLSYTCLIAGGTSTRSVRPGVTRPPLYDAGPATSPPARGAAAATIQPGEEVIHVDAFDVEPEHHRGRLEILWRHYRVVRYQEHSNRFSKLDLDFGVHPRAKQPGVVVELHDHREHGDVLLHERLRLDLLHYPDETLSGIRFHGHGRPHSGTDVAHVRLIHQGPYLHEFEVGHDH